MALRGGHHYAQRRQLQYSGTGSAVFTGFHFWHVGSGLTPSTGNEACVNRQHSNLKCVGKTPRFFPKRTSVKPVTSRLQSSHHDLTSGRGQPLSPLTDVHYGQHHQLHQRHTGRRDSRWAPPGCKFLREYEHLRAARPHLQYCLGCGRRRRRHPHWSIRSDIPGNTLRESIRAMEWYVSVLGL